MKVINLWSSPRNISTALMYSFAQRPDTTVVDEPLYAYYLANTQSEAQHPGVEEIMASQSANGKEVIKKVLMADHYPTPLVVHKQMTHHLLDLDRGFLHRCVNVMLIRDPRAILASYTKVIQQPTADDIGIPQQTDLYHYLKEYHLLSAILDAQILLQNPGDILRKLCERLAIPFSEKMLHWKAGPIPEDGVWAKHWYANVHASTGFKPFQPKNIELPGHLEAIAQQCQPAYAELLADDLLVK